MSMAGYNVFERDEIEWKHGWAILNLNTFEVTMSSIPLLY